MKLQAYTRTIQDILSMDKKYIIPRFQREYSWTNEQLNELWKDIIFNIKKEEDCSLNPSDYFIGSLVLVGEDTSNQLEIVDGQQRMTTLTILFSALAEAFKRIDTELAKNLADGAYVYVEGRDRKFKPYFRLVTETSKPFFQTAIQYKDKQLVTPQNTEEKTLLNAYKFFDTRLKKKNLINHFNEEKDTSLDEKNEEHYILCLEAIRDQILKLETVYITVPTRNEAYTIFETLNAKGMDLSTIDLIKNSIFQFVPAEHPSDFAKETWNKVKETIRERDRDSNLSTFFRHYWISKYEGATEKNIYRSFNRHVPKIEQAMRDFLLDLEIESRVYKTIANPIELDWNKEALGVYSSLKALKTFNISSTNSLILALLVQYKDKKVSLRQLKTCVEALEKFHFIFSAVCSSRASGLESKYGKYARALRDAKNSNESNQIIQDIIKYLQEKLPKEDIFLNKWDELEYTEQNDKKKKIIQYIFAKWETNLLKTDELIVSNITIEHISPQSGKEELVGKIGNLLPLAGRINSTIGNDNFNDKIKSYRESRLETVQEFVKEYEECESWDNNAIIERSARMASIAYNKIWKI
ncbi:DUF262 domain-containing protein [Priestia megaterium]